MKTVDVAQRSEEWFAARRGLPTCSRFDKILTPARGDPSKAQGELINELLAESLCPVPTEGFIQPQYTSIEMEHGMRLEASARCLYELSYAKGAKVTEVGLLISDCGRFGGSPDALVGEDGGVEIKAPTASVHVGYIRGGVLPISYKTQVHGHLIVSGRKFWDFFAYHPGIDPFIVRTVPDDFTAKLAAELNLFCERYNEARARFKLPPIGKAP